MKYSSKSGTYSYSDQDRKKALEVSLTSLAASLGYTPVRFGSHYSLKEMDSLIIYNDRSWNRWSGKGNITGGSQIDFMLAFGGAETVPEAIKMLLEFKGERLFPDNMETRDRKISSDQRHNFVLPPQNNNYKRLYAYLMQTRGLSQEVISDFVHRKLIYEDSVHHNIVFCGRDPEGNIRYAGLRGTADIYGKKFKMDVPGNDKNYGVNIVNRESDVVKVFESVIDCMSYIDLFHDHTSNMLILSMVADNPLEQFLKDYDHIKHICFCLDNDKAGQEAIYGKPVEKDSKLNEGRTDLQTDQEIYNGKALTKKGLKQKYEEIGYQVSVENPIAEYGKDFNENLLNLKKNSVSACIRQPGMAQRRSRGR